MWLVEFLTPFESRLHSARADNIERVRRDEEEARIKEECEEGRMMMAVS